MTKNKDLNFNDFDEFQKRCEKTAVYPNIGKNFTYPTIGFMGEAGELANKIKKLIRDDNSIITNDRRTDIKAEMGDALWYMAQLCTELGLKFSEVAKYNVEKLSSRKVRGKLKGSGDNR